MTDRSLFFYVAISSAKGFASSFILANANVIQGNNSSHAIPLSHLSHSTRHTQVKKVSSSRTKKNRFSHGVVIFIEYKSVFSGGEVIEF
jgi:hypothetical protein